MYDLNELETQRLIDSMRLDYWKELIRASQYGLRYSMLFSVRDIDGEYVSLPIFMLPDDFEKYYKKFVSDQLSSAAYMLHLSGQSCEDVISEKALYLDI